MTPINRKRSQPRRGRVYDPQYLDFIRRLQCVVCSQGEIRLTTFPSEAAHVGERGLGQKCSDRETVPLCARHHRSGNDSQHSMGARFWSHFELDKDALIARLNDLYGTKEEYAA